MDTISESYLDQYKQIHKTDPQYGTSAYRLIDLIYHISHEYRCSDILDYGCGKGVVSDKIGGVTNYDPAIERFSDLPKPHTMVICLDVLEHCEPEYLDNTLNDLRMLTGVVGFFVISTNKAMQILPDGRNAHLIVEPPCWWIEKVSEYFEIKDVQVLDYEVQLVVEKQ